MQRTTNTNKLQLKRTKMHRHGINVDRCCPYWKMHVDTFKISNATLQFFFPECCFKTTRINKLNMVEKQPFLLSSAQECIFQTEFSGHLSQCVLEMHDFLTFITGTHVLNHGTNSFLLENFLEHQMSSEILIPLLVIVPQYWDQKISPQTVLKHLKQVLMS